MIRPTTATPSCFSSASWPLPLDKWPAIRWQWYEHSNRPRVQFTFRFGLLYRPRCECLLHWQYVALRYGLVLALFKLYLTLSFVQMIRKRNNSSQAAYFCLSIRHIVSYLVSLSSSFLCGFTSHLKCITRFYWNLRKARTERILQRHGSKLHQGSSMCSAELHINQEIRSSVWLHMALSYVRKMCLC